MASAFSLERGKTKNNATNYKRAAMDYGSLKKLLDSQKNDREKRN
jgi:hypothetical protein